jgi:hypothetical protein
MSFCGSAAAAAEEEASGALLGGGAARSDESQFDRDPQHARGNGLAVGGLSFGDSRYVG